jgi:hypothetical protein
MGAVGDSGPRRHSGPHHLFNNANWMPKKNPTDPMPMGAIHEENWYE